MHSVSSLSGTHKHSALRLQRNIVSHQKSRALNDLVLLNDDSALTLDPVS